MALEYSLWGIGKRPAGMVSNRQKLAMSEVKNSVDGRSSMRFDLDRCRIVTVLVGLIFREEFLEIGEATIDASIVFDGGVGPPSATSAAMGCGSPSRSCPR